MSNNPFLKSKQSKESCKLVNNRFSSLQDDENSSFKESSNKSCNLVNRKSIEYEASQNSFTQASKPHRDRDRDRDRDRNSGFNHHNNFNTRTRQREPSPPPKGPDANDLNVFPELIPIKENSSSSASLVEPSTKFKDILKNVIEEEVKPKNDVIPPGWARLTLVNRKTVIEYGEPTKWMIKQQKQEELEKQQDEDPNYIMFHAIESMKKNWDRYEREYNEIHGEGAYDERFRLPPVYGPDYDTESETETEDDDDDDEEGM
jgi:hypothetical protein